MEAIKSFEAPGTNLPTTQRHITGDVNLQEGLCETLGYLFNDIYYVI
jgi:hypothetical protein